MKKGSWIVKLRAVVTVEVITGECTEEEATKDPYGNMVSEDQKAILDWEIESVAPNE